MAQINFGGVLENVVTRDEFPLAKAQELLKNETIAVIGYGVQGPGQSLNMRDNGINVIIGQRRGGLSWDKAVRDGWVPGKNLFELASCLVFSGGIKNCSFATSLYDISYIMYDYIITFFNCFA